MRMNFHIRKWIEAKHSNGKTNLSFDVFLCCVRCTSAILRLNLSFNWTQWRTHDTPPDNDIDIEYNNDQDQKSKFHSLKLLKNHFLFTTILHNIRR